MTLDVDGVHAELASEVVWFGAWVKETTEASVDTGFFVTGNGATTPGDTSGNWFWVEQNKTMPASGTVDFGIRKTGGSETDRVYIANPVIAVVGASRREFFKEPLPVRYKTATAPTQGYWAVTDESLNSAPIEGAIASWVCVRAGWSAPLWVASTAYALGDVVRPTEDNTFFYLCTVAGTSDTTEPTWPTGVGGTVIDSGTLEWTRQTTLAFFQGTGLLAQDSATITFPDQDLTPYVRYGHRFKTANTLQTNITDFDAGYSGQVITIEIGDDLTDLVHAAGTLELLNAQNANTLRTGDFISLVQTSAGAWVEQSRSINQSKIVTIATGTAAYTVLLEDRRIICNTDGVTALTITLPLANDALDHGPLSFWFETDGGQNVTINRAGSDSIDDVADAGNTAITMEDQNDGIVLLAITNDKYMVLNNIGCTLT